MKTRQKIMDAFWSLYTAHAMEEITVGQIAKKAGIHRSTFYHYFPDRYAVLEAIEDMLIDEQHAGPNYSLNDLPQRLHEIYRYARDNASYLKYLVWKQQDLHFVVRLRKKLTANFEQTTREVFPDLNPSQRSALVCSAMGFWLSFLMSALCDEISEDQAVQMLMQSVFRGILPGLSLVYGFQFPQELLELSEKWLHSADFPLESDLADQK